MAEIMPLVPKVEVEIQKMELLSSYSLSVAQLRYGWMHYAPVWLEWILT